MEQSGLILILISLLSLSIWVYLLGFRGQFWRTEPCLDCDRASNPGSPGSPGSPDSSDHEEFPSVCVVIPARNEAEVLPTALRSLLTQAYPGDLSIILVDDHSTDGTAAIAQTTVDQIYAEFPQFQSRSFNVLSAQPLPSGWTGKLWALEQGTQAAMALSLALSSSKDLPSDLPKDLPQNLPQDSPDYLLLTDADIAHDHLNLWRLVNKAIAHQLDMTSVMVRLRCDSRWEQLLIPAFVFFFQKLYPFRWANQPKNAIAAAAGGCILLRPQALQRIGGIGSIRHALIDDCALALAIKWHQFPSFPLQAEGRRQKAEGRESNSTPNTQHSTLNTQHPTLSHSPIPPLSHSPPHPIWIGLSHNTYSLRPYPDLKTIWDMVARTAYTQLNYSPLLLMGTLVGMTVVYLVPVLGIVLGLVTGQVWSTGLCGITWLLMAIAYTPILRFYRCPPLLALGLPAIAVLYTLMTLDSALRYWQGRGGAWKGRTY